MFNSKSHALTMMPLAERLSDDGHDVSMYTISASRMKISSLKVKILESLIPVELAEYFGIMKWFRIMDLGAMKLQCVILKKAKMIK
ncbi:hypothetical protein L3Y34_004462 [Caenorhabditis briggsae]|uniref:Uncharacterized protein n=1 Tax=Caenorhabditis briggsae TaxID=6238 RepID=A0AAE9D6I2_CAEBR|nr:hypothetical protein L3Y34_004462 [Caenorhabditis briggsae]